MGPAPAGSPASAVTAPPSAAEVAPTPPPEPPVVLEVTVLRADGSPAAGAVVRVFESDPVGTLATGERDLPPLRGRAVADADGNARFEIPGWLGGGFVGAFLGDEADLTDESVHLKPGARHAATLRLEASCRVRGRVVDRQGRPVEASSVRLLVFDEAASLSSSIGPYAFQVEPESLVHGTFEFAPLGTLPKVIDSWETHLGFRVRAEGFLPYGWTDMRFRGVETVAEAAAREGPVEIVLTRPGTVRGRCVDPEGRPVVGAVVDRGHFTERRGTGEDGRFEVPGFPETGGEVRIECRGRSGAVAAVPPFDPAEGTDLGDIALGEGETVCGVVVDDLGVPVAGAGVWVGAAGARTDAEGRFAAEHAAPPPWHVYAQHGDTPEEDCRRASFDLETRPAGDLRIVLSSALMVRFEIGFESPPSPGDNPWHQVTLRPEGWKEGDLEERVVDRHTRLLGPRFRVREPGNWTATVAKPGYEAFSASLTVAAGGEAVVRVTLRSAGAVPPR